METTAERGQEVRHRLLQAAAALIAERGWTGVSTRALAQRAGVSAGVVHYHFSSVQALLVEAALVAARSLVTQLGSVLATAGSVNDALDVLLGALDTYSGDDAMSVLFIEAYLAAARDEQLQQGLGALIGEFRRQLADLLAAHGVADPEATALVLAASIDGVLLHRALLPGPGGNALASVFRRLLTPSGSEQ